MAKTGDAIEVRSPYDDALVAVVHRAGPDEIEMAIAKATDAFQTTRKLPVWKRAEILETISAGIAARHEDLAKTIALEAGKPIRTARAEVDRAVFTFKVAAEESKRIYGEIVPLDWLPGTEGREAQIHRVPLGPVAGISPFNFPLTLVAHKVAPAFGGWRSYCSTTRQPDAGQRPQAGRDHRGFGLARRGFSVVPSSTQNAAPLVEDERIRLLTFTGSPAVGWSLKTKAGRKRVTLELGGNAGVIVHSDADVAYAAERVAWGGFSFAGQSCISVQRVYIHAEVYDSFVEQLVQRVNALQVGDPLEESTDVGPLIDPGAAERVEAWVSEAKNGGVEGINGRVKDRQSLASYGFGGCQAGDAGELPGSFRAAGCFVPV